MLRTLDLAFSLVLPATLGMAQQASYNFFGAISGNPNGCVPQLSVSGLPQLGTTFSVSWVPAPNATCTVIWTMPQFYHFVLVSGFSNQSWGGLALPAQLPAGFTLLVSHEVIAYQVGVSMSGTPPPVSFAVSVPNDPGFLGLRFFQQMFIIMDWCPPYATNGGDATVGL